LPTTLTAPSRRTIGYIIGNKYRPMYLRPS